MKFMSIGKGGSRVATQNTVRGFTLVELMVSVSIFAFMTAFLMAKYGTFNRGIFLTNLAYDIALTIRSAQSYGLNVQGVDGVDPSEQFLSGFGAHFEIGNPEFLLYADDPYSQLTYDEGVDIVLDPSPYTIKRNNKIVEIKYGAMCELTMAIAGATADISFKRPNPDARIIVNGKQPTPCVGIVIEAPDGTRNTIEVRSTGQIAVKNQ
jgi:prepilin-type N-terminal cleavage/methylation domain-containing protein